MAKISFYLDLRRPKKDGSGMLKISISHKGDIRYISLGINLTPAQWDGSSVTPSHKLNRQLNLLLRQKMVEAEMVVLDRELHHLPVDAVAIHAALVERWSDEPPVPKDLIAPVYERWLSTKSGRTHEIYATTLGRLKAFCPGFDKLTFDDVDLVWLSRWDKFMSSTAPSVNARAIHLRNLRAVFNFAIDEGITTRYPFRRFKIRRETTAKRSLTVEELRVLFDYDVEPYAREYRDMFMLIFMLIGINLVDLSHLNELAGDRAEYVRAKTHRFYSVKVEPEALEIINRYRGERWLVNILDRYASYKDYMQHINAALRKIGPVIRKGRGGRKVREPLFPQLSTYWARHSWATIAASLDIPKETIAAALGHGGNTVTDIYINFDRRKVDEANRRVIDWVLYGKR